MIGLGGDQFDDEYARARIGHVAHNLALPRGSQPDPTRHLNVVNLSQKASTLAFWPMRVEAPAPMPLMKCLAQIEDPRRAGYVHRHDVQEILAIAVCAVQCDLNSFEDMASRAGPGTPCSTSSLSAVTPTRRTVASSAS